LLELAPQQSQVVEVREIHGRDTTARPGGPSNEE
jgi:hypothetical protein